MYDILLVEDSQSLAQIMEISLKQAGFSMHEARTPEQAILDAEEHDFDLILCDADLANCDVTALVKKLSSRKGKNHKGLIAFSKEKSTEKRLKILAAGADRWIEKPFDVDDLVNDILSVMH